MQVEQMKLSELIPYANNAKLHSAEQIKSIASSIKEFGFNNPILLDKDNGIIAGHGRAEAAKLLELDLVPCIKLGHLSDVQRRAYILADNRLAEVGSSWNMELVQIELEQLKLEDFDTSLIGFDFPMQEFTPSLDDVTEKEDKEPQYILTVICKNEEEHESLFRELNDQGFKVKAK